MVLGVRLRAKTSRGRALSLSSRPLIGSTELLTGGEESEATLSPKPPVNNSAKKVMTEDFQISPYAPLGGPPTQEHEYRAPNVRRLTADFRPWVAALAWLRILRSLRKPFNGVTKCYKAFASESRAVCPATVNP